MDSDTALDTTALCV